MSCESQKVVDDAISEMSKHFGNLTVSNRNEYQFLGMNIKFNEDQTVTLMMTDHIKEAIDAHGPADRNLFLVNEIYGFSFGCGEITTFVKVDATRHRTDSGVFMC